MTSTIAATSATARTQGLFMTGSSWPIVPSAAPCLMAARIKDIYRGVCKKIRLARTVYAGMKTYFAVITGVILTLATAFPSAADLLVLKDGDRFTGTLENIAGGMVTF